LNCNTISIGLLCGPATTHPLPNAADLQSFSYHSKHYWTRQDGVLVGIKESLQFEFFSLLADAFVRKRCRFNSCLFQTLMDAGLLVGGMVLYAACQSVPHVCKRLYTLAQMGDWAGAAAVQEQVSELAQAFASAGRNGSSLASFIGACKWTMYELGLISSDHAFAPFEPFTKPKRCPLRTRFASDAQLVQRFALKKDSERHVG